MMKRPSLCLIRRRYQLGTCMVLVCSQRNCSPNSIDHRTVSRLEVLAFAEKGQALAGRSEPQLPLVCNVKPIVGALSP